MLSAIIVIVGISLLILLHELGHFIAAKKMGLRVDEFGFGFPPRMFSIKKGETTYSFNWLPFGGFVRLYGESKEQINKEVLDGKEPDTSRSFAHQSALRRSTIILAGIVTNFVLGWLIISSVFMIGAAESVVVTQVAPNSPAEIAGFLPGDELVGYVKAEDFTLFTSQHKGTETEFTVSRDGTALILKATPRAQVAPGEGALGVGLSQAGFPKLPFFTALAEGWTTSWSVMGEIVKTFGRMIGGLFVHAELLEGVVGPVGIFGVAGDLGSIGFVYVLQLIGLISLNLAVLNAMPFPALDGGRFLFILIEKIKGSAISPKKEMVFNLAGFGVLIVLMVAITARDIIRLF
ncbi:MAG: site-2 protease family protein [bacterium]|nr:site-2 protease family protein [bacterium]